MASTIGSAADNYRQCEVLVSVLQAQADELTGRLSDVSVRLWNAQQSAREAAAALCEAAKSNV